MANQGREAPLGFDIEQSQRLRTSRTSTHDALPLEDGKDARPVGNVDDWLPVTGDRTGQWWYAAFHTITAMVGAGVLGLPHAMSYLTWGPGVLVLVLSWVITLFTMHQLVEMHEMIPGERLDRYHELGQKAFGQRLGFWIVVPQQLVVEVGVDIVYMLTGAISLQYLYYHYNCTRCNKHLKDNTQIWILIFGSVHFVLSQLPTLNSITGVSLSASIMALSYSTITWAIPAHLGVCNTPAPDYHLPYGHTNAHLVFGAFNALGVVAFAYAGHNVALEIQATLPSTPDRPSKKAMWRGVLLAYGVVAACYFPVAIVGYWAYSNQVGENLAIYVTKPSWLVIIANLMVVIHMIGSYQIYAMPVYDNLETLLVYKFRFNPSFKLRLITRSLYVGFTMGVAMAVPDFQALMGFLGGFAFAPTTYFLPCIMWLAIYKPKVGSLSWITNWSQVTSRGAGQALTAISAGIVKVVGNQKCPSSMKKQVCIVLGVLLMLVSTIGGVWDFNNHKHEFIHPADFTKVCYNFTHRL